MQAIPTTPLPSQPAIPGSVEESRARRREKQQSRFRNRGGIFVPTERNDLADLLLGRAKRKSIHERVVSASPTRAVPPKRKRKSVPVKNTSPKRQQRKSQASRAAEHVADDAAVIDSPAKEETASPTTTKRKTTRKPGAATTAKTTKLQAPKPRGRPRKKSKADELDKEGTVETASTSNTRNTKAKGKSKDSKAAPQPTSGDEGDAPVASSSKNKRGPSRNSVQEADDDLALLPPPKKRKTAIAKESAKNIALEPIAEEDEPISRAPFIPVGTAVIAKPTRSKDQETALPDIADDVAPRPVKPRKRKAAAAASKEVVITDMEDGPTVGGSSNSDASPPSSQPPPASKKKRTRDVESTNDPPLAKRPKSKALASDKARDEPPKPQAEPLREVAPVEVEKSASMEKKAARGGEKAPAVAARPNSRVKKLKENGTSNIRGKTKARGPRPSVVVRSQQAAHDLDDEPDPIDFLS